MKKGGVKIRYINSSTNDHIPTYKSKKGGFSISPFRLLLLIMCAVFIGETTVMIILAQMPDSPVWSEALFDSAFLVMLLFPVMYFLFFRPLVHHIYQLKSAEKAIRKSQERFKQIFEGSPIGIAVYDNDGSLLISIGCQTLNCELAFPPQPAEPGCGCGFQKKQ